GDVVFMVGSPQYASPGHVGIIISGSGSGAQVMSYYHKGAKPHIVPIGQIHDGVGIKRFYLVKKDDRGGAGKKDTVATSTPTQGDTTGSTPSTTDTGSSDLVVGHAPKKPKKAKTLLETIPQRLKDELTKARSTSKTYEDDI